MQKDKGLQYTNNKPQFRKKICKNESALRLDVVHNTVQIQMEICRARLTNCPGTLTNVRMLCETGEL